MVMRKYQERRLFTDVLARVVQYKHGDATRLGSSSYCWGGQHRFTGNTCCARTKWRSSACEGGDLELQRSAWTRAWAALSSCVSPEKRKSFDMGGERGGSMQTQEISALHA